jgi:hypothetical protein
MSYFSGPFRGLRPAAPDGSPRLRPPLCHSVAPWLQLSGSHNLNPKPPPKTKPRKTWRGPGVREGGKAQASGAEAAAEAALREDRLQSTLTYPLQPSTYPPYMEDKF